MSKVYPSITVSAIKLSCLFFVLFSKTILSSGICYLHRGCHIHALFFIYHLLRTRTSCMDPENRVLTLGLCLTSGINMFCYFLYLFALCCSHFHLHINTNISIKLSIYVSEMILLEEHTLCTFTFLSFDMVSHSLTTHLPLSSPA